MNSTNKLTYEANEYKEEVKTLRAVLEETQIRQEMTQKVVDGKRSFWREKVKKYEDDFGFQDALYFHVTRDFFEAQFF